MSKSLAFYIMEFGTNEDLFLRLRTDLTLQDWNVVRADIVPGKNIIHQRIYNSILISGLCIVDISSRFSASPKSGNRNVFYELGLAHALGRPTVIVCNDVADIPFDINQNSCIVLNNFRDSYGAIDLDKVSTAVLQQTSRVATSWSSDNPFWANISPNYSELEKEFSYDYSVIRKVGKITIHQTKKELVIEVEGDVTLGLVHNKRVEIQNIAVGCRLKRWGWTGRDFVSERFQSGQKTILMIKKTLLFRVLFGILTNQFRFSLYARSVNHEVTYFDLRKWVVSTGYLRDDNYGSHVLVAKI